MEDDADLLVEWHADPEIARYWDNEQFTRDEMLMRLASPEVDAFIVEAEEKPVGYLQAWFDTEQPGRCGLDMFLVPSARGRGLGPDAARTLATYLSTTGQTCVTVDPYRSNGVAIRAWTKAGFEEVEEHERDSEHSEPWVLMVFAASRLG
jgi:aminoglycoside 6'-N-acetyltransferase